LGVVWWRFVVCVRSMASAVCLGGSVCFGGGVPKVTLICRLAYYYLLCASSCSLDAGLKSPFAS